jgi:hypothetical protein
LIFGKSIVAGLIFGKSIVAGLISLLIQKRSTIQLLLITTFLLSKSWRLKLF